METHSSILARRIQRIPWTEESGGLQSDMTERLTLWLFTFFTFVIDLENMSLFIMKIALQNRLILPVVLDSFYASFHICFVIFSEPLAIFSACQPDSVDSSHSSFDCKTLVATALFPHSGIVLASPMDELWFPDSFHWAHGEMQWLRYYMEKAMATYSCTLAWKIPWMEEPGRLQSMGSLGFGHDWATSLSIFTFMHWRRKWQPTPVFLPGESQGWGSLVGCHLWVAQSRTWLKRFSSSKVLYAQMLNCVWFLATPWTLAQQAPLVVHGIFQARILERVAISFSKGPSPPRDWTHVSCIVGRFFTNWAATEAPYSDLTRPRKL